MNGKNLDSDNLIPRLFALASKLEGEGQYNNAKLVWTAADSISRQAAVEYSLPSSWVALAGEYKNIIESLAGYNISSELLEAMQFGMRAMSEERLPLIHEAPNPYVCRTCGYITLETPSINCPRCSSHPDTFKKFIPAYWLDNYDPYQVLENLRRTPVELAALLKGMSEEDLTRVPVEGEWNIRNAVSHIRDAQSVLELRLKLMVEQDNPLLESKAVFEWASEEGERPPRTMDIFKGYSDSRRRTNAILEGLTLKDWRRAGRHEEFGTVTITQQASYFATHELTHLPQIINLLPK